MSTHLSPAVSSRDHSRGPENAPVTLVEYGDFECPHCGRAFPIVEELLKVAGDDVRFVFRNFPLSEMHEHAERAAEAAEAAGAQGKFWEMHHALFTHQNALEESDLLRYAAKIGLNAEKFENAFGSREFQARVREDFVSGVRSGVNGTPTFFINGKRWDDAWDLDTLLGAIRAAA